MESAVQAKLNSYLTFRIGEEEYGAHVREVINILELQEITKVPKAPDYMKGVINLRGKVLPVIDTRVKMGLAPIEFTENTCIIVMELHWNNEEIVVGALVDEVKAVLDLDENEMQEAPGIGSVFTSKFIRNMAKVGDRVIMILDLIKLFSLEESRELQNMSTQQQTN